MSKQHAPIEGSYHFPVPAGAICLPSHMDDFPTAWSCIANALDPVEIGHVVAVWLRAGGIKISRLQARAAAVVLKDADDEPVTFDPTEIIAIHRVRSIYRDL